MKTLKVIPLLDSIPKISSFSNYGIGLEKIFKMNSLKNLIHVLKFKKEYQRRLIGESKKIIKIDDQYDIYEQRNKQKKLEEEEQMDIFSLPLSKSESKLKIKKQNNMKKYYFHKKNTDRIDTSNNFLAYKYNPNFNSIYKNVPSVKIFKPISETTKNKNILFKTEVKKNLSNNNSANKDKDGNKNKNKSKENKKDNNNKYLNTVNSYKNFKYAKNLKNKTVRYRNSMQNTFGNNSSKKIKSIDSDNRFVTEISFKSSKKFHNKKDSSKKLPNLLNQKFDEKNTSDNSIENNNNKNEIPFHFKNRAVDFTKMRSRKTSLLKNSMHIPEFGYYEPKYNLIEKRQYDIFFDKKPETNKYQQKKILLQKIVTSYDVESIYQTIDNNKLNNDILKRYKFLK
jgi:hypothetical protein